MDKNVSIKQIVFTVQDHGRNDVVSLGELPEGLKIDSVNCSTDLNQPAATVKGDISIAGRTMLFTCKVANKIKSSNRVTAYIAFVHE